MWLLLRQFVYPQIVINYSSQMQGPDNSNWSKRCLFLPWLMCCHLTLSLSLTISLFDPFNINYVRNLPCKIMEFYQHFHNFHLRFININTWPRHNCVISLKGKFLSFSKKFFVTANYDDVKVHTRVENFYTFPLPPWKRQLYANLSLGKGDPPFISTLQSLFNLENSLAGCIT